MTKWTKVAESYLPRVGDQYELELGGPGRAWREPWSGKSPRELTKASITFRLGPHTRGGVARG